MNDSQGFAMMPGLFIIVILVTYLTFKKVTISFIGSLLGFGLSFVFMVLTATSGFFSKPAIWKLSDIPEIYGMPLLIVAIFSSLITTKILITIPSPLRAINTTYFRYLCKYLLN